MADCEELHKNLLTSIRNNDLNEFLNVIPSNALLSSSFGYKLLCTALEYQQTEIVIFLLENKVPVNTVTQNGSLSALHLAVIGNNLKIIEMLLAKKASIEARADIVRHHDCLKPMYTFYHQDGYTPLHLAVEKGNFDIINLLLKSGADVNSKTKEDLTPIHIAAIMGTGVILKLLVNHGASMDVKYSRTRRGTYSYSKRNGKIYEGYYSYSEGFSLLHSAIENNNNDVIKTLLNLKFDVNVEDAFGTTPLMIAAGKTNFHIVRSLLDQNANLHNIDYDGKMTIHYLFMNRSIQLRRTCDREKNYIRNKIALITLLIRNDANCDAEINGIRLTALHLAAYYSYREAVELLVNYGVNVGVQTNFNGRNYTALELAHGVFKTHDFLKAEKIFLGDCFHTEQCCRYEEREATLVVLIKHVMKMRALGVEVCKQDLDLIYKEYRNHYDKFDNVLSEEVDRMRNEFFCDSYVSFYDIVVKDIAKLAMYARNKNIFVDNDTYRNKFPNFYNMASSRFNRALKKKQWLDKCDHVYFIFRSVFKLPDYCVKKIFSYLSRDDVRNFY
ncbi:putative ankyrin repeat protein RF_0381 [Microplitis demolitor]|uniref:putative ankyrin repeat protein RF_0381 n=1 Tax=Microplitis demolitor TaxID=69319 RepID=UPI000440006C|nr:putative ankyrin repeat protein RF_0381 [Microplitis demolitor]